VKSGVGSLRGIPGTATSWWRRERIALAACAALGVAAAAFVYRFNTLGGTLGGFDNDHFAHLMRVEMLLAGEQPLRDFADAELRGAWPALSYAVPAWAQQVGGRTLLAEAYLTVGAIALAHAIVFLLALDLSRRWSIAFMAAAVAVATTPKLYNYPKVLMLTLGALALGAVASNPSTLRLALAAVVTAAATLFRHDYGVYVAAGCFVALIARAAPAWPAVARSAGVYAALTTICLLPSALWVQAYEGIPAYLRNALATSALETTRTELRLPPVEWSGVFTRDGLLVVTYYAFWAVLVAAAAALVARTIGTNAPLRPAERGTAIGLLAMAALVNTFFLRANLDQRFGDAIVPVALLAAWTAGAASGWPAGALRVSAVAVPAVLLLYMFSAAYVFSDMSRELDTSGLSDSWGEVTRRYQAVRADLGRLPPVAWSDEDAVGTLSAARYVAECTAPDDYLLVAGHYQEIPVFARRRFAAGQPTVSLSFYTSEGDQRRALARLERQSVPIVLADAEEFEEGFVSDYPLLAQHLADAYRETGTIAVDDEPRFRVFVDAHRQPTRVDPHLGLPCFR
jgi:hypothetical protein